MGRLFYESLRAKVWELFPFVLFEYEQHSVGDNKYKVLVTVAWSFKGKAYKCFERGQINAHSCTIDDVHGMVKTSYRNIINDILESIEEVNNEN